MADLPRLFTELIRFETELWNAVDARLRESHDLPLSRFEPMQVIARREGCRVNDIARDLAITVGGTSKIVDRIEASGHGRRQPHPGDRRSSMVVLTGAGARLLAAASETFEDELGLWFGASLTDRDAERLTTTLARLRRAGRTAAETRGSA